MCGDVGGVPPRTGTVSHSTTRPRSNYRRRVVGSFVVVVGRRRLELVVVVVAVGPGHVDS